MVPARIMRLVGASCLGLRLGINPTDGASLGFQLCIWCPGGELANGARTHTHTHTHYHPMHTYTTKLGTQLSERSPTYFIIKSSQLILFS